MIFPGSVWLMIEFNPSGYHFEKEEIMFLESKEDSKNKTIVVPCLFDRTGGYCHNPK
jgi:hypothetical protein